MGFRELAAMLAPNTMNQVDQVAGRPTPGGVLSLPLAAAQDVARPALALADSAIGGLSAGIQSNPNIGRFLNAANAGFAAANGDPYYRGRSASFDAQAGLLNARAGGEQANSRLVNAQAGLIEGFGGGQPGAVGQGGGFEITDQRLAQLAASGNETMANSLRATRNDMRANKKLEDDKLFMQQAVGMDPSAAQDFLMLRNPSLIEPYRNAAGLPQAEDVRGEVNARRKSTETLDEVMRNAAQLESMEITEENAGAWQQPIGIILNKLYQPDSAVLLAEVDAITDGMVSMLKKGMQQANRVIAAGGSLPAEVVKELREMALSVAATAAEYELDMTSRWEERSKAMGLRAPERARANVGGALMDRAQKFVDSRRSAGKSGIPVIDSPFMQIPNETLQPIIDQVENEMPGLDDQALLREVKRRQRMQQEAEISERIGIRGN